MGDRDTDVLIVGAGPTGQTLAAELAVRGVRCRIVDAAPERSDKSRALVVQPRTLEVFRSMGFADELVAQGQRSLSVNLHVGGRQLVQADVDDLGLEGTPYPFVLFASQAETEACLDAHLQRLAQRVERPVKLVSFREEDDVVIAELEGPEGTETVAACYLVGCDGAHSTVRHGAGLRFEGDAYAQDFMLADVDVEWPHGHGGVHLFFGRRGVLACLPMRGDAAYRLVTIRSLTGDAPEDDPTLDEVHDVAEAMSGGAIALSNPRWLARFRLHHRGVDRYRCGRVFVAGDAAHIHSPAGGQGMNTGIQDAFNLGWKLALVVAGRAPDAMLESYHEERHPIGQFLLRFTDRMFRIGSSPNWMTAQVRMLFLPRVAPLVFSRPKLRARAFRFVSQLAVHYRWSSLGIEPAQAHALGSSVRPGDRAPDAELDAGGRLLDAMTGPTFSLLAFVTDPERIDALGRELDGALVGWRDVTRVTYVTRRQATGVDQAVLDPSGNAFRRYGAEDEALFVVRPDGYVGTRVAGTDTSVVREYFAGLAAQRQR